MRWGGTRSSTEHVTSTRVWPNSTWVEPSACRVIPGVRVTGRRSSAPRLKDRTGRLLGKGNGPGSLADARAAVRQRNDLAAHGVEGDATWGPAGPFGVSRLRTSERKARTPSVMAVARVS